MQVRDIMTENPEYIESTDSVAYAIELLNELDVRHLPVMSQGELVGMVSDRDLLNYNLPLTLQTEEDDYSDIYVSEIMTPDTYSVGPEDDLVEIIRLMIDQKFGAVPVIDPLDGTLVGIVSYIDILKACEEFFDY